MAPVKRIIEDKGCPSFWEIERFFLSDELFRGKVYCGFEAFCTICAWGVGKVRNAIGRQRQPGNEKLFACGTNTITSFPAWYLMWAVDSPVFRGKPEWNANLPNRWFLATIFCGATHTAATQSTS
jgi:hypothetical protein